MPDKEFFNEGRRGAISEWALNLSVVFISAGLVGEAFADFSMPIKGAVLVTGFLLLAIGVSVAPDTKGGR